MVSLPDQHHQNVIQEFNRRYTYFEQKCYFILMYKTASRLWCHPAQFAGNGRLLAIFVVSFGSEFKLIFFLLIADFQMKCKSLLSGSSAQQKHESNHCLKTKNRFKKSEVYCILSHFTPMHSEWQD
jgi:hypothetical protein